MIKQIKLLKEEGDYGEEFKHQLIMDGKSIYSVHNLTESPEDAIIGRDLQSGWEIIDFIRMGMSLAQEGYTKIEIVEELIKDNE